MIGDWWLVIGNWRLVIGDWVRVRVRDMVRVRLVKPPHQQAL